MVLNFPGGMLYHARMGISAFYLFCLPRACIWAGSSNAAQSSIANRE